LVVNVHVRAKEFTALIINSKSSKLIQEEAASCTHWVRSTSAKSKG